MVTAAPPAVLAHPFVPLAAAMLAGLATGARADAPATPEAVKAHVKISDTAGGFGGTLADVDELGVALAPLGDLDGDGVADLAASAVRDDGAGFDRGALWVLFLDVDGTVKAEQEISDVVGGFGGTLDDFDFLGISLASLGDVDGDGVVDLAAGATGDDDGGDGRGAVWILFLDVDGTVKAETKISDVTGGLVDALVDGASFGAAVAGLGDLDGDGVPDLAVGALDGGGGPFRGSVRVLFLATDGTVKSEQRVSDVAGGFGGALDDGDLFGTALACLGDIDGDGRPELAVGAPNDDDGGVDTGAIWILSLEPDGTVASERKIAPGVGGFGEVLDDGDALGNALAALGDVNGDGVVDLAAGAVADDDGGRSRGAVRVLFLDDDASVLEVRKISDEAGAFEGDLDDMDQFGRSVGALGDLDGDGVPDLAVGANLDDDGGPARGAIWTLFLSASTWTDVGAGLPGTVGTPCLAGQGALVAGAPLTLALTDARPLSTTNLVVGLTELGAPFKGGTLVPALDLLIAGLPTDGAGALTLGAPWPASVPSGVTLWFQHWVVDPTGPAGFAASNALAATTP